MANEYILKRQSEIAGHDLSKCFFYDKRYTVPVSTEEMDEFFGTNIPEIPHYYVTLFDDFFLLLKERAVKRRQIRMANKLKR